MTVIEVDLIGDTDVITLIPTPSIHYHHLRQRQSNITVYFKIELLLYIWICISQTTVRIYTNLTYIRS